jgi:hypothetical protein
MTGPYMVACLHQNLIFDARAAWGKSSNNFNPFNTYTNSFESERERPCELVTAPLTSNRDALLKRYMDQPEKLSFTVPVEAATHLHFDCSPSRGMPRSSLLLCTCSAPIVLTCASSSTPTRVVADLVIGRKRFMTPSGNRDLHRCPGRRLSNNCVKQNQRDIVTSICSTY